MEKQPTLTLEMLEQLEKVRDSRVIIYITDDLTFPPRRIENKDVPFLYECLQAMEPGQQLDLVLHTVGGDVNASRKIALLLRTFASHVTILVPYKARSAGTLLCLGADEILMGPLGELGPIDPQIMSTTSLNSGGPQAISSRDIQAFKQMAETWFELRQNDHRMQVFKLLSEHIFPTSLSAFYRAEQQVRQIAAELLQFHLPGSREQERHAIIDHLVNDYHTHDYALSCAEVQALGLRASVPRMEEASLLWQLWRRCRHYLDQAIPLAANPQAAQQPRIQQGIDAIIASHHFQAAHIVKTVEYLQMKGSNHAAGNTQALRAVMEARWQIL